MKIVRGQTLVEFVLGFSCVVLPLTIAVGYMAQLATFKLIGTVAFQHFVRDGLYSGCHLAQSRLDYHEHRLSELLLRIPGFISAEFSTQEISGQCQFSLSINSRPEHTMLFQHMQGLP